MGFYNLADILNFELLIVTVVLLLIMLINNITLYKVRLTDHVSVMLISSLFMSVADQFWRMADGNPSYFQANYFFGCCYVIAYFIGVRALNLLALEWFDIRIPSKNVYRIIYVLPLAAIILLCLTSPWTHMFFMVGEDGVMHYMPLYDIYVILLALYDISVTIISLRFLLKREKKNSDQFRIAVLFIVFSSCLFIMNFVQESILSIDDNYVNMGIAWAVSLMYLTTNVNTDRLVRSRERVATVEADLNFASKIQLGSLPKVENAFPSHDSFKLYATMEPAKEVGGDFFDFYEIDDTHICFVMADVSGKGVPAALFMMTTKTMIKDHATMETSPAKIFTRVNRLLSENNEAEMFATAWIGILDTETNVLRYTNAAHAVPCIKHRGEKYSLLKKLHGLFLAGMDDTVYTESEIKLESGDAVFLYTDGVTEAHNMDNKLYGEQRLLDCLNRSEKLSGDEIMSEIKKDIRNFSAGREQFDDITMMMIKIV